MSAESSRKVFFVAVAANLAIAIAKFIAAWISGSSAMLAEGFHSAVDTGNELMLLIGSKRSARPPDELHPFGHGKELYFWSLLVGISVFAIGGGLSLYEGVTRLRNPAPLENPLWSYVVLGIAAAFEGYSWHVSSKELRSQENRSLWQAARASDNPGVLAVFLEDSADLVGISFAFLGIFFGHLLNNRYLDPVASVLIGCLLVAVAALLLMKSSGLLIGEALDRDELEALKGAITREPAVNSVRKILTMQLGPHYVLANIELAFRSELTMSELEPAIRRIEENIRNQNPKVQQIFIEAASLRSQQPS